MIGSLLLLPKKKVNIILVDFRGYSGGQITSKWPETFFLTFFRTFQFPCTKYELIRKFQTKFEPQCCYKTVFTPEALIFLIFFYPDGLFRWGARGIILYVYCAITWSYKLASTSISWHITHQTKPDGLISLRKIDLQNAHWFYETGFSDGHAHIPGW